MTRREAIALLLVATGWADCVVTYADGGPPSLSMAFGPPDGFRDLRVTINGELIVVTPDELLKALKAA